MSFESELRALINRESKENGSNTPDAILAGFLSECLRAFDVAVIAREGWYGRTVAAPASPEENTDASA